jgi:hypothetical protein
VSVLDAFDTEELQADVTGLDITIGILQEQRDEIASEVNRRTSPWPWPKTPSPMAQFWRNEFIALFETPCVIAAPWANRARPNSGE